MANVTRRRSSQDAKAIEAALRTRVRELEEEVGILKRRLDELRKAKNTTILKREREVLEVGAPFGKRDSKTSVKEADPRVSELEEKLSQMKTERQIEMAELRQKFAAEVDEIKRQKDQEPACNHEEEISSLKERLTETEALNAALLVENSDSKERVKALVTQLSEKEAQWCDKEEKYKLELKTSWGAKYAEWMSATEKKIQDLQAANEILRGYLKNQKPGGRDPSGQDT